VLQLLSVHSGKGVSTVYWHVPSQKVLLVSSSYLLSVILDINLYVVVFWIVMLLTTHIGFTSILAYLALSLCQDDF